MLLLKSGLVKDQYILARVTKVYPDDNSLVRKVEIKYRRKNSREAPDVCKSKREITDVAGQNLALVVPVPRPSPSSSTRSLTTASPSSSADPCTPSSTSPSVSG